jgi:hypothetical protein
MTYNFSLEENDIIKTICIEINKIRLSVKKPTLKRHRLGDAAAKKITEL